MDQNIHVHCEAGLERALPPPTRPQIVDKEDPEGHVIPRTHYEDEL